MPSLSETEIMTDTRDVPSLDLLRAWAADLTQEQCWGLDAVADELEELRETVALDVKQAKVNASTIAEQARHIKRLASLLQFFVLKIEAGLPMDDSQIERAKRLIA